MFRELKNKFVNDMADKIAARLGLSAPQNAKRPLSLGYGSSFLPKTLSSSEAQSLLAYSFQKPVQSISFKTVAVPGKGYAQDALGEAIKAPALYGLEGFQQDIIFTFFAKYGFIGYQACSLLQQHWLINNACTIPNEDALRPGWKTTLTGGKDNADLLQDLSSAENKKYDIYAKALKWGRNRKIFGLALAYPVIDGVDTEKPFNIDGVKPGSFKGIAVIDPYWCMPEFDADTVRNPLDPDYFKPAYYVFNGRRVHRSHLLIWLNDEPSDILKPSYIYGGIPLTQQIYERVYAAEKSANEAPEILLTKRSTIAKSSNLDEALFNEHETAKKLTWMRKLLNNFGIWLTDCDVHQLDTTLTGLCEIIDNQYKLVAAVAKIPEHKLMKTNPSGGLGNKGEFSTKDYRLEVCSLQEYGYKPFIERIEDIILRSEFGVKTQTDITFNELDLTDQTEKAALLTQKTQNLGTLIDKGIISPDEGRKSLIEDENSGFAWLPEDAPEDLITPQQEEELKALASGKDKDKDGGKSSPSAQGKSQAGDEFDESKVNRDELGRFAEQNKTKADNPPDINSFLGEEFTGYKGQEAVNKLLQEQRGHIKAAFTREDIGDITLAWGNEEQGIAHLIKSRTEKSPYNVDVILERLTETIENGQLRKGKSGNFEIWHKGIMVIVRPDYYGEDIRFVVTGFKQRSPNKNSTTREDATPGF